MGWSFHAICWYIYCRKMGIGLWDNKYFCEHLSGQQWQIICVLYLSRLPLSFASTQKLGPDCVWICKGKQKRTKENKLKILGSANNLKNGRRMHGWRQCMSYTSSISSNFCRVFSKTRQLLLIIIGNSLDMILPLEFRQITLSSLSVYLWPNHNTEFMIWWISTNQKGVGSSLLQQVESSSTLSSLYFALKFIGCFTHRRGAPWKQERSRITGRVSRGPSPCWRRWCFHRLQHKKFQKVSCNLVMQGSYYSYSFVPGCYVNLLDFYQEYKV